MTKCSNLYVRMDVHKETIDIALAEGDGRQEVRHYGSIGGDLVVLDQAVRKLQNAHQLPICARYLSQFVLSLWPQERQR